MPLGLLGPVELRAGDRVIGLPPRERVVIALLGLNAGRVVPVDHLIEGLWEDSPPATARGQVQISVSRLRRALADAAMTGTLWTRTPGYQLRVTGEHLDLVRFQELVAAAEDAEPGTAVAAYRRALDLWRGDPLSGLPGRLVQSYAAQLIDQRLRALERLADLELKLGHYRAAVDDLGPAVARHPLRERLRSQLMLALHGDGRRAEALDEYQNARRVLVDELGLEPGEDLRQAERIVLTATALGGAAPAPAEAAPAAESRVPRMLPTDIPDFVGNPDTTAQLDALVAQVTGDGPAAVPVAVISGAGGTGKTTLAVHLGSQLADHYPGGVLFATLRGIQARPTEPAEVLALFLRALGVVLVPDGTEERAAVYRDRLARRRVLVVLDDAASEAQVLPLLPGDPGCLVLVTSRARLTGLPAAARVEVGMMSPGSAVELLRRAVGPDRVRAEPEEVAAEIARLCGYLPLAVRIAASRLASRPDWTLAQLAERLGRESRRLHELSHGGLSLRASISLSYEALDADAQRLFRRLGLLDAPDFGAWIGAPLLSADPRDAEDVLGRLVDARLVEVHRSAGEASRYRMHDLVRAYARERLSDDPPAERTAALNRVLGAWLFLAEAVHLHRYGDKHTLVRGPVVRWALSGDVVDRTLADSLAWYEAERFGLVGAVRQAAEASADELCWSIAVAAVTLFEAHSYLDDWRESHGLALDAVRRTRNRRGEAALTYSLGALAVFQGRIDDADRLLTEATTIFAGLDDRYGWALAQRNLAFVDRVRGRLDDASDRYAGARDVLREHGDLIAEAHVLNGMAQIALEQERWAEAQELLEGALDLVRAAPGSRISAQLQHRLGELYQRTGRHDQAGQQFRQVLAVVRSTGDLAGEAHAMHGLAVGELARGRYDRARTYLVRVLSLATRTDDRLLLGRAGQTLARLLEAEGDLVSAARERRQAGAALARLGAVPEAVDGG